MICPMVPFPVTLSDPSPKFQGHGVIFRPMSAINVLCAQLTRDLFVIGKFLLFLDLMDLIFIFLFSKQFRLGASMC